MVLRGAAGAGGGDIGAAVVTVVSVIWLHLWSSVPIMRVGVFGERLAFARHAAGKGFEAAAAARVGILALAQLFLASDKAALALLDLKFPLAQAGARGLEFCSAGGDVLVVLGAGGGEGCL